MSQAELLLNTLANTATTHTHSMKDSGSYFVIDPVSRTMSNGSIEPNVIMQYDHDSEIYTFEVPRYVDGHDMMLCNQVLVHWNNIGESDYEENAETSDVYDLRINPNDTSTVICSWKISRNSTQLVGILSFLVQYKCVEDGVTTYEWHTDIYSDVVVKEGRTNGEASIIEYTDIIEQWRQRLFGAGDSVIADIAAASEEQLAAIDAKGKLILASIPEDHTTVYNSIRTKANAIQITAEGEAFSVTDASDDYLRDLHIYGRTTQVTTEGTNLLQNNALTESVYNALFTVNKDGTVYVRGTATNAAYLTLSGGYASQACAIPDWLVPGETYTISDAGLYLYSADESTQTSFTNQTFTMPDGYDYYGIFIRVGAGVHVDQLYYPRLNTGSVAYDYEPYSGGFASPSPDWPQEPTSIENPSVELYGRNLLDQNGNFTSTYSTYTLNVAVDHGTISVSGTSMLGYGTIKTSLPLGVFKKGETYRISRVDKNFHVGFWFYDNRDVNIGSLTTENSLAFTVPDTADHMSFFYAGLTPETEVNLTEKFMLNLGTEALPWEPSVDTQTISIPHTLRGIPVTSDGNYTDFNGQQWICDEVDFVRGVYIQRIGVKVVDGINNKVSKNGNGSDQYLYYCGVSNNNKRLAGYCTHFVHTNGYPEMPDEAGMFNTTLAQAIYFDAYEIVSGDNATLADPNEFNEWFATQYAAGTPVTVYYALLNPIETPLTDAELLAFRDLHSNYLVTTALNSENAYIGITYNADTKTYLDRLPKATDEQVQIAVDAWLSNHFISADEVSF